MGQHFLFQLIMKLQTSQQSHNQKQNQRSQPNIEQIFFCAFILIHSCTPSAKHTYLHSIKTQAQTQEILFFGVKNNLYIKNTGRLVRCFVCVKRYLLIVFCFDTEVRLWVCAYRANLRCFFAFIYMAAVAAMPFHCFFCFEYFPFFYVF